MYKVGDKVNSPRGTGTIIGLGTWQCKIKFDDEKEGEAWFIDEWFKPITSAHDKLLDIGWVVTVDGVVRTYQDNANWLNAIWVDKAHKTVSTNFHHGLVLSRILTQLLEEME